MSRSRSIVLHGQDTPSALRILFSSVVMGETGDDSEAGVVGYSDRV